MSILIYVSEPRNSCWNVHVSATETVGVCSIQFELVEVLKVRTPEKRHSYSIRIFVSFRIICDIWPVIFLLGGLFWDTEINFANLTQLIF
jgi:hypothetical protein